MVKVRSKKLKSDSSKLVMNAHLVENLKKKDQISEKNNSFVKDDPFLPPYEKGMFITEIGEHRLLYNKFPVVKNHVLVVTKNFEDQHSLLEPKDLASSFLVMKSINGIAIYNSGEDSGAS